MHEGLPVRQFLGTDWKPIRRICAWFITGFSVNSVFSEVKFEIEFTPSARFLDFEEWQKFWLPI